MSKLDINSIVQHTLNQEEPSRIEDALAMKFYGQGVSAITDAINRSSEMTKDSLARNNEIRASLGLSAAHTAYATRLDKQDDDLQAISRGIAESSTNAIDLFAALIARRR